MLAVDYKKRVIRASAVLFIFYLLLLLRLYHLQISQKKFDPEKSKYLFSTEINLQRNLNDGNVSEDLRQVFKDNGYLLLPGAAVKVKEENKKWIITDKKNVREYTVIKEESALKIYEFKDQHKKWIKVTRPRGNIYDRHGEKFAVTIEAKSLYLKEPSKLSLSKKYQLGRWLSPILDKTPAQIEDILNKNTPHVPLARKIDPIKVAAIEAEALKAAIDKSEAVRSEAIKIETIKSEAEKAEAVKTLADKAMESWQLYFGKEYKRFYPKRELASHVVGFVDLDNKGQEGIEGCFDSVLAGPCENINVDKDGRGTSILIDGEQGLPPPQGYNLVLTIDEIIQYAAEIDISAACRQHEAPRGTIIVMKPKTGEILAMAVYPLFNPNSYSEYNSQQRRNITITDPFEPGSTFKTITTAAVLGKKVVDEKEGFYCPGYIEIAGRRIACHHKHENLTFREAIEESCNVAVITAALRLTPEEFYTTARDFGFCTKTGIQLPAESSGRLIKPRRWSKTSLPTLAIGQGMVSTTPLQLITAISVLANGGKLMKPLLVKKVIDFKGEVVKEYQPEVVRQVISPSLAFRVTDILKGVVERGTGKGATIEGYSVAGKTGTAQKVDPETGRYSKDKFVASFIGYLPADDPRIIMLVVIDEPKGVSWGSKVAAPVFKRLAYRILPHIGLFGQQVPSTESSSIDISESSSIDIPIYPRCLPLREDGLPIMVDLTGLTMREVWRLCLPYKLEMELNGSGVADSQLPLPDTPLYPGTVVRVSFKSPLLVIPNEGIICDSYPIEPYPN
ncbi:MAG: penicillin-binding transpeptidase domain-containing protein [bacterium]|nr:penicillin-binding transpeptidase domain-containing protein [bacterium]